MTSKNAVLQELFSYSYLTSDVTHIFFISDFSHYHFQNCSALRPCFSCARVLPQDDRGHADDQASWAPDTSKSMQMKSTKAAKEEAKEEACPPCHLC